MDDELRALFRETLSRLTTYHLRYMPDTYPPINGTVDWFDTLTATMPLPADTPTPVDSAEFRVYTRTYCHFCDNFGDVNNHFACRTCVPRAEELYAERQRQLEEERERIRIQQERAEERAERQERLDRTAARAELRARGERRFGIELEVEIEASAHEIANRLSRRGVECNADGYTHEVMDCWKVVPDSSVSCGWEIVSPPMTMARAKQDVVTVTDVLKSLGAMPTRACGLHVHHEVKDLSVSAFKRLVNRWHTSQPHIDCMVANHRKSYNGEWAGAFNQEELQNIGQLKTLSALQRCYVDRYRSLNITAFHTYGTVEVRQYQSTLDPAEILAWVKFGQHMIEDAIRSRTYTRGAIAAPDAETFVDNVVKDETSKATILAKMRNPDRVVDEFYYDNVSEDDEWVDEDCDCYECRMARR